MSLRQLRQRLVIPLTKHDIACFICHRHCVHLVLSGYISVMDITRVWGRVALTVRGRRCNVSETTKAEFSYPTIQT